VTVAAAIIDARNAIVRRQPVSVPRAGPPHADVQLSFEGLSTGSYALGVTAASGVNTSSATIAFWIK